MVPDRWHPKINTTWRSLGRARTIERAERLTNARALRLNRGSPSRFLWRDGRSLRDAWATTSDSPLCRESVPLYPGTCRQPRKDARLTETPHPRGSLVQATDDPAVRRGASGRRGAFDRVRRFTASAVAGRVENRYERLIPRSNAK